MGFAVQGIDHVEVFVRDMEKSIRWYGQALGLREVARWDPEPVMIGAGETKLALFRATEPHRSPAGPHWHRVAWWTDRKGFAEAQKHLTSLGIPFRGPIDHGKSQSIYFQDPDANLLEITVYP